MQRGYYQGGGFAPPGPYGQRPGAQSDWMPRPHASNCPPGLEYLMRIDQILVKQKKELLEVLTDLESSNQYVCVNTLGQKIYHCKEESNFYQRQCFSANRSFTMHVHDNSGMEVLRVERPYKYTCIWQCFSCAECCQDEVDVQAPIGHTIGYVRQVLKGCHARYHILDASRNVVLQIHGPSYCDCPCLGKDVNFRVMSSDGFSEIGRITKQFTNILKEWATDADNFGVTFPMDLDVRMKATLLGAVFLIDFMFFENNQPKCSIC